METRNGAYMNLNGDIVRFEDARLHCLAPAVTYAANVFEGVRAYWNETEEQLYVFRLADHLRRLGSSAKVMRIAHTYDHADLTQQLLALLRKNEARESAHMRIHVYVDGDGYMSAEGPAGMFMSCVFRPTTRLARTGCRAQVSSWTRIGDNASPPRIKSTANYFNGRLASMQAKHDGYDTAILLTASGTVAEGPGACLFMVRDGEVVTPDIASDLLESITRDTIIRGCPDWIDRDVVARPIGRTELYAADEVFFCGTGQEVLPVVDIDGHAIGRGGVGPLTRTIQSRYFDLATGRDASHPVWRTPVYV